MNLIKLADDIEDVTEPASMDKILLCFQELQEEDEEFMQLLFEKLKDEIVTWEHPWYQATTCLTRKLIGNSGNESEQYRTDTITKEENEKIKKNWRKFRKQYNLPDKLISFSRWRNKDRSRNPNALEERVRRYVAAYLARGLERTVHQVFKHIMTHFGEPVKRHYTPEEEKIMEVCFHHNPRRAVTYLSNVLGREPRGIYKRLAIMYSGKPDKKRLKWTLPLATKFLNLIMKYSGLPLEELKYKRLDKSIWLKVQDDMEQQYVYLQYFWQCSLHVQLFVKYDVKLNKLKKKIFKILKNSSYQVWTDIRWKDIVKEFPDGFTHHFLYRICAGICCRYPNYLKVPIQEIIDYGLKRAKMIRFKNRRLKTLRLNENGDLERTLYHVKVNNNR